MNDALKCECGSENFFMKYIEVELPNGKTVIESTDPEDMIFQCSQCNKIIDNYPHE